MKKICHMTSAHHSLDERIFYKECISLVKAGYNVSIVSEGESFEKDGVSIIGIDDMPTSRIKRIMQSSKKVYEKALKLDADVYHIHDPELLPYAHKLKRMGNKKVIFDSHEDVPQLIMEKEWIPKHFRKAIAKSYERYQKFVCKKLDAVISVTPHICDKFKIINPKTYLITNYPVLNEQDDIKEWAPKNRNRTICFAGGISEQWCHDTILIAIENIKDVKYNLCGFGNKNYLEKLKTFTAWNKVEYIGKIHHLEVPKLLSSSCVGMALLRKSGNTGGDLGTLGNTKLFEYMLAGIPVICTNFVLWQKIIDEYNCGICVDLCNTEEITDAIKYLLDNPDIAIQMGFNGRKAVFEKYNWYTEGKKLLNLYKELT